MSVELTWVHDLRRLVLESQFLLKYLVMLNYFQIIWQCLVSRLQVLKGSYFHNNTFLYDTLIGSGYIKVLIEI